MKKIYIITIFLGLLIVFQEANAQQDPQYTQYMYNMNVVNPAYAGSKESLSITALYRNQWAGISDNPVTMTFSAHSPLGDKVGLGLNVIKDELGPVSETNINADFSYNLELGGQWNLALGIKAGAKFHDIGLYDLDLQDPNDPFFGENISNVYATVGAGLFLSTDNFYFGASVPNFINSVHLDESAGENQSGEAIKFGSETNHFFATAGYVFQVSDNVKLKPSTMVKAAFDSPISFDVNLNALFFEKFELGASYRWDDSFSGIVGFQVLETLRIGYAYDYITSDLSAVAGASHEIILSWDLFFKKKALRSPRYF